MAQMVKNPPAMQEPGFNPWVGRIHWRMEWLSTPVFWPGEFHGQRSLVGYSPWGCKKLGTAEQLTHTHWGNFYNSGSRNMSLTPSLLHFLKHLVGQGKMHLLRQFWCHPHPQALMAGAVSPERFLRWQSQFLGWGKSHQSQWRVTDLWLIFS